MPSPGEIQATIEAARRVLEADARIAYALVFGSAAREDGRPARDLDLAVGLTGGTRLSVRDLGDLLSRLEKAAGKPVDLVLMQEAPPGLAYRVFAGGRVILERDRAALVERKAQAIIDYLDFKPIEELCAGGALAAARGR
jgi:predicted nucleotidyltransferase